ncbi:MAG: ATP-binding protein, partial [Devosiaceae bacterium]|nr:ATP-binding protein [Devosiaceae bacterium]
NIIGFSDMLDSGVSGELNKKQQEYTSYIKNSSQRLGILIDNILDLATIDAGVAELDFEQVDIMQLVERAKAGLVSMNDFAGTKAEINLIVKIENNLPPLIADSTRIVQILYNLLANAMRFSEVGSKVWLNISSNNDRIIFTIEDEGEGISEEMKAVLFNRFERKATQGQQTGAGLGLAIVKSFVNLHSGSILLEKREPKGTRIIVSLPTNAEQAGSVEQASISA